MFTGKKEGSGDWGGVVTRKGEEDHRRGIIPLTVKRRRRRRKRRKEAARKCNRTRSEPSDSSF